MKARLIILQLFLSCAVSFSQVTNTCTVTNAGFESGNTTGWILKSGGYGDQPCPTGSCPRYGTTYTGGAVAGALNSVVTGTTNRHTLMSTAGGNDPNATTPAVPVVAPGGGTYSFRLGNAATGTGGAANLSEAEAARLTFPVTNQNAFFTYRYAFFVQDGSHAFAEQPSFEVVVLDQNDALIPCGRYFVVAGNYPGCVNSTGFVNGNNGFVYKPWTDVGLDLTGYIGQNISIEFRTTDCLPAGGVSVTNCSTICTLTSSSGGSCTYLSGSPPCTPGGACGGAPGSHSAYCYIDAYCSPLSVQSPVFCAGASSVQICAPTGYASYSWPAGQAGLSGSPTTQCVTINNPVSGATYTVNMVSATGCPTSTKVTLKGFDLTLRDTTVCAGSAPFPLVLTPTVAGTYNYSWSPSTGLSCTNCQNPTFTPGVTTTTYTVTMTDPVLGCSKTKSITITIQQNTSVSATGTTVCSGVSGTLTATGQSCGSGVTYAWSPSTFLSGTTGASVTAVNPTTTTTYTITVTNGSGQTAKTTAVLTVNPKPIVSVPPATICAGTSATLTASGATTYTWSPTTGLSSGTGTSVTANPTVTSTYTVVGTNTATGCTGSTTVIVTVNPNPVITVPPATICNGFSATLTASGATTYTWSPTTGLSAGTGTSVTANPTATTTYTVIGTTLGCTGSTTVVVTVNPNPVVTVPPATICSGFSATLTASGAATYTWNPTTGLSAGTGTSVTANPTTTTTYTVTGSNPTGCTGTTTVVVTVNPNPVITVPPATICAGTSATLTASGATTYTWNPTTGLSAGTGTSVTANPAATKTYTVTGSNPTGCTGTTTVVVTVNPNPVVTVPGATICPGATVPLTASGATTYTWSPATGLSATTGASVTASSTVTTTYTVIGTTNGCTGSATVVVTVLPPCGPFVSATGSTVCNGICGSVTSTAGGGTAPYTFAWNTGATTTSLTPSPCPTVTTTYTITVTDNSVPVGSATAIAVITVNPNPVVTVPGATICAGASATLTASGATTYAWSPATGLSSVTGTSVTANPTVTSTYTVTGSNPTGCTGTTKVTVIVNPIPVITVPNASICPGGSTPLTASGATTYTWAPTTSLSSGTGTTVTANPAATTTYTVIGTANGCTASTTVTVTVGALVANAGPDVAICFGTSTQLNASGGTIFTWTPATGLSNPNIFNPVASPTVTTTYTVVVSDGVCSDDDEVVVTVNPLPTITATGATICNGACAIITASGAGTGTYAWAAPLGNGASQNACPTSTTTYSLTGTDANGCTNTATTTVTVNPIPVVTVPNVSICPGGSTPLTASGATTYTWAPTTSLSSGTGTTVTANPAATTTYTVIGTANGCTASTTVTVTVGALVANAGPDVAICFGTSTQLNASGGTIFTWTPATGLSNPNIFNPVASPTVTTTYTVVVSDGVCSDDDDVVVTVDPPVTLNVAPVNVTCFGACNGQTIVIPSGGNGIFSYNWSSGCTGAACSNVCAGTYTLTATDGVGCTATGSVTVTEPTTLTISGASTNVSCFGVCDGTASVTAGGATPPYAYTWTPSGGGAPNATGLCAGSYTCTVTDANACSIKTSVSISQPTKIVVTSAGSSICPNQCANLNSNSSGGTAPYTYSWAPGSLTTAAVSVCPASTTVYSITTTDANGCTGGTSVTVIVNPTPIISVPPATICEKTSTTLNASGAATYTWAPTTGLSSGAGASVTASPAVTTTYTVIGTSTFGCTGSITVTVTVNPAPVVTAVSGNACPGMPITLTASGAASYSWAPPTALNTTSGPVVIATTAVTISYVITGTSTFGCTATATATATVNPKPVADFTTSPTDANEFNPTIYFYDQSTGGPIIKWDWTLGDSANTPSSLKNPVFIYPPFAHTYPIKLIVTNQFGCMDTVTGTVIIHGIYTFYIPNTFTPNNDGVNDGFMPKGVGIDESDYDLWIFDRWGNLIWHTDIWGNAWDGRANGGADIAQIDTYVWKVHVKEKESGAKHNYIGHVNIVK